MLIYLTGDIVELKIIVHVKLEESVVNRLIKRKKVGQSYSDIVSELLNIVEKEELEC